MPGTDLVQTSIERQIRSYHRAFTGELVLHTFGGDLRPWRPIPARGVFWMAVLEVMMLFFAHTVGLSLPLLTPGWVFVYLMIPGGLAALFTTVRIEGRRLHVVLVAWTRHVLLGSRLIGGIKRIPRHANRTLGPSKVNLTKTYQPPCQLHIRRYAIASLPLLALFATIWVITNNHGNPKPRVAHAAGYMHPVARLPLFAFTFKVATHKDGSRPVHHPVRRVPVHKARRSPRPHPIHITHVRHIVAPRSFTPITKNVSAARVFTPTYRAPIARIVRTPPHPTVHVCYPGELGC